MTMIKQTVLAGIKPTGRLHLGHYQSVIKPALDLQKTHDVTFLIAEVHALNTLSPDVVEENTNTLEQDLKALGIENVTQQGLNDDIPIYFTVMMSHVTKGMLERCHAYKALDDKKQANMGLFTYPVLMSADILAYKCNQVLVGQDQAQHLEFANDLYQRMGAKYRAKPLIVTDNLILGSDGRKMSKSYDNTLPLDATDEEISQFVKAIKTDSLKVDEPKSMDDHLLVYFMRLARPDCADNYLERLNKGGFGYGKAKQELVEALKEYLRSLKGE